MNNIVTIANNPEVEDLLGNNINIESEQAEVENSSEGGNQQQKKKRTTISTRQFYAYHLQVRPIDNGLNNTYSWLHSFGCLFH